MFNGNELFAYLINICCIHHVRKFAGIISKSALDCHIFTATACNCFCEMSG